MAMYATASELASYLEMDLDTATATQALTIATALFVARAHTQFQSTAATYTIPVFGAPTLTLPLFPVTAVSSVTVNAVTITGTTLIGQKLYRRSGFGSAWSFPPDVAVVSYTHGYTAVPDDVKGAVLETAGAIYSSPDVTVLAETIDDYSIRTSDKAGGYQLSPAAQDLAEYYRGALVA